MGWRLHWQGEDYRESDLTIGQAERIEELTGDSWLHINVVRSARQAAAVLAVMAADRSGRSLDEVRKDVEAIPVNEYSESVLNMDDDMELPTEYLDGNPPVAAAPSTPGSSTSASRRGAGRRK